MKDDKKIDWQAKIKQIGPTRLVLLIITGILLLSLSYGDFFPAGTIKKDTTEANGTAEQENITEDQYRIKMENRVKELLRRVEGVGKVEVMITLSASKEKVALKDNETGSNKTQEESVIVEDSDRNSSPYIIQEKEPVPEGILVVCEGGGDVQLAREIIGAIQVLFDVDVHKIKVMKMEP